MICRDIDAVFVNASGTGCSSKKRCKGSEFFQDSTNIACVVSKFVFFNIYVICTLLETRNPTHEPHISSNNRKTGVNVVDLVNRV